MVVLLWILFWLAALLASCYWGYRGAYITFRIAEREKWPLDLKVTQFLFNFIGSLLGWFAACYFILRLKQVSVAELEWTDLVVLLIAFLGINGHLPYVAVVGRLPK